MKRHSVCLRAGTGRRARWRHAVFCGAAVVLGLAHGPVAAAQPSPTDDGVTLEEILQLARQRNPRLKAFQAAAEAAGHRVAEASTLPDPALQLGVMNFGVPDLNTDMAMSMAPALQLTQRIPFPGKLSLRGAIADDARGAAEAAAEEAWWQVRAQATGLFYRLYAMDRRLEVMRETLTLLEEFQDVAKAMYAAGRGRQADVLRADVEVARVDGDIRQLEARRRATAARLNALLDRPASTPVPSPVLPPLPLRIPDAERLEAWAAESRPYLDQARTLVAQADKRLALARKQIWPDLALGLSYGQRDRGQGPERMGSVMVGFTLPIHAGSRQYALRDEATALRRFAESELAGREAEVGARIGELLAELDRARTLVELYRDEVIPQARANVESAFSSYRVGAVDFMTLVDAELTVNRYEGELYALVAAYGTALAALESTVGKLLPHDGPLLTEER